MKVVLYSNEKNRWDEFVQQAKNTNFLFYRDFLEYHHDRFDDFSLMIFDKKDKLLALLPANKTDNTLHSHQGLTYGGFILSPKIKLSVMTEVVKKTKDFLQKHQIKKLIYKPSPYIYHDKPSQEDLLALSQENIKLFKRDIQQVIPLKKHFSYSNGRKHSIRKAKEFGFLVEKSDDFKSFWDILESVLKTQHNSKPVHSLKEIEYLYSLFPKKIELYLVKKDNKLFAGAVVFVNKDVVKLQYVANFDEGRKLGALDFLIDRLIKEFYHDKSWFDFGTSSDKDGINFGLIDQKERFGASGVLCDTYLWDLS